MVNEESRFYYIFKVKRLRVNLDLFCPEGRVINGESRFWYIFKVKWWRVNLFVLSRRKSHQRRISLLLYI